MKPRRKTDVANACDCPSTPRQGSGETTQVLPKVPKWPTPPRFLGIAFLALLVCTSTGFGQGFALQWFTVDGGGGSSSNGQYNVFGTIGQPDAGHMGGGNYSIDGGFWGIIGTVPAVGVPPLRIALTATNTIVIAWPAAPAVFTLQEASSPAAGTWSNTPNVPVIAGTEFQVIISPSPGNRFFRLTQ